MNLFNVIYVIICVAFCNCQLILNRSLQSEFLCGCPHAWRHLCDALGQLHLLVLCITITHFLVLDSLSYMYKTCTVNIKLTESTVINK